MVCLVSAENYKEKKINEKGLLKKLEKQKNKEKNKERQHTLG